jgi:hypothetical protein
VNWAEKICFLYVLYKEWRKELPAIRVAPSNSHEDRLEAYNYVGRPAKYLNIEVGVTSRFLKKATNCRARLRFKPREKTIVERKYLAWDKSDSPDRLTIVKGDPQRLHVFLFTTQRSGACLSGEDLHFVSAIEAGHYDYFHLEIFCEEWAGFKVMREWNDVDFPQDIESLPIKTDFPLHSQLE